VRILFDTNVVLDVILNRQPFREASSRVLARVENGKLIGVLCATTLTTIYYLVTKASGKDVAHSAIRKLLELFEIATVDQKALKDAADSPMADFEDAVLLEAGAGFGVDAVVTRDPEDFQKGRLPVFSPWQFHQTLGSAEH
jgi:predicted nucleic acid-binding protein